MINILHFLSVLFSGWDRDLSEEPLTTKADRVGVSVNHYLLEFDV